MWEIRVGWDEGGSVEGGGGGGGWPWDEDEDEDLPRRPPNSEPRMEEEELGTVGWPREEHSCVVTLRRRCGLLMVDPCGRKEQR